MMQLQQDLPSVETPGGALPPFERLFDLTQFETALATTGDLLWLVTYLLAIWVGFKHRSYAIPLLPIALNVAWEFIYTVFFPSSNKMVFGLHAAWLLIDLVILYQLYRFGRKEQTREFFKRHYHVLLTLTLVACFGFLVTYHRFSTQITLFPIEGGNGMAFLMNLVMSVLFIGMLLERKDLNGLSLPIAWTKMLGTALIAIANVMTFTMSPSKSFEFQFREAGTNDAWQSIVRGTRELDLGFFYFLFGAIFVFDVIYIVMLTRARQRQKAEALSPDAIPAAAA